MLPHISSCRPTPIYRGSTVLYPNAAALRANSPRYTYGTKGTPTTKALEDAWTELSNAEGTVLAPTGLAAITLALMARCQSCTGASITPSPPNWQSTSWAWMQ